MARSTLLYLGFSFTDGYFNELRSELMTLRGEDGRSKGGRRQSQSPSSVGTPAAQPFSYAVIDGKPQAVRSFYNNHEGVHLFSWQAEAHGYGVMDRYLECVFRCTNLAAALSHCKVLLFNPKDHPLYFSHGQVCAEYRQGPRAGGRQHGIT